MKTQQKNAAKKKAKAPAVKKAKAVAKNKMKSMATGAKKAKKKAAPTAKSTKTAAKNKAPKTAKAVKSIPELKVPGEDMNFIPKPNAPHQLSPLEAHDAEKKFHHQEEVAFQQENQKARAALSSRKNLNRFTHRERNK